MHMRHLDPTFRPAHPMPSPGSVQGRPLLRSEQRRDGAASAAQALAGKD